MTSTEAPSIHEFRDALLADQVRVEFAPTYNFTQGRMVETARVFVKADNGRWRKVAPLLLPRDGGDRADLLADLAKIARGEVQS